MEMLLKNIDVNIAISQGHLSNHDVKTGNSRDSGSDNYTTGQVIIEYLLILIDMMVGYK